MQKIFKITGVSMLAIMAATNANAAGYTCEELVEYTSCEPGHYLAPNHNCPEGYHYATNICYDDDMGEYYTDYEAEDCTGEYYAFYQDGCLAGDEEDGYYYEYEPHEGTVTVGCSECPAGSSCEGGAADKVLCAAGTYQPETAQAACIDAPAGSYVKNTGATTYTACAAGTYQAKTGQTSCDACADGTIAPSTGATSCETCPTPTMYPEYATVTSKNIVLVADDDDTFDLNGNISPFNYARVIDNRGNCNGGIPDGIICSAVYKNLPIEHGTLSGVACSNFGNSEYDHYSFCTSNLYSVLNKAWWQSKDERISCDAGYWSGFEGTAVSSANAIDLGVTHDDFVKCPAIVYREGDCVEPKYNICQNNVDFFMDMVSCKPVGNGYFSTGGGWQRAQCPVMTDASGNTRAATTESDTASSVTECVIDASNSISDDKGTYSSKLNCTYDDPNIYVPTDGNCIEGYSYVISDIDGTELCYYIPQSECEARIAANTDTSVTMVWNTRNNYCRCNKNGTYAWHYDGTSVYCSK